jgi:hypothetical protein
MPSIFGITRSTIAAVRRLEGFQAVHAVVDDLRIAVLVLQEFLERGGGATIVVDDENSSHGAVTYRHSAGRRRLSFASPTRCNTHKQVKLCLRFCGIQNEMFFSRKRNVLQQA